MACSTRLHSFSVYVDSYTYVAEWSVVPNLVPDSSCASVRTGIQRSEEPSQVIRVEVLSEKSISTRSYLPASVTPYRSPGRFRERRRLENNISAKEFSTTAFSVGWKMFHELVYLLLTVTVAAADKDQHPDPSSLSSHQLCSQTREFAEKQGVFKQLLKDYDKTVVPATNSSVLTQVEVTIQDIQAVSDITSSFQADIFYSQLWTDPRLRFDNLTCVTNLSLDESVIQQLWTPKVALSNSKDVKMHMSPTLNTLLIIFNTGKVWLNYRLRIEAPCAMNFGKACFFYETL